MAKINKIKLSGTSYDIQDLNASKTVELTQAQYDALVTKDPNTFYIITDAEGGDLSNYYTKSETSGATQISTALNSKQDTLVSGTNIKTINNESILGSGNIDIQGGGSSYTAGDGIDITNHVISVTGKVDTTTYNTYTAATDTALASKQTTLTAGTGINITDNVISATGGGGGGKAIEAGSGIAITTGTTADTIALNEAITATTASSSTSIAIGSGAIADAGYNSFLSNPGGIAIGSGATAHRKDICIGNGAKSYDVTNYGGISIGNSSITKNGGISIGHYSEAYGKGGFDDKGGISIGWYAKTKDENSIAIGYNTVASGTTKININNQLKIDTNNQIYIKDKTNTNEICLQDYLGGGGASYSAGTGIDITNNVISVSGVVETSAITTAITSSSTDAQVPSAKAVNDKLGGLNLVKLTQAEYDALATKDNSILYVIVN